MGMSQGIWHCIAEKRGKGAVRAGSCTGSRRDLKSTQSVRQRYPKLCRYLYARAYRQGIELGHGLGPGSR
jgi:hypothetical protein